MAKNKQDIDINMNDYRYAYINLGDKTIKVNFLSCYYLGEGMFKIISYQSSYVVHASNVTFEK